MVSLELRAIAALASVLVVGGGLFAARQYERAMGARECEAGISAQYGKDVHAARAEDARITTEREAGNHEADKFRAQATADRAVAPASDQRVRDSASALLARCLPQHPAAGIIGQAAASAPDLSAELRRRIESAQRDVRGMAEFATTSHAASVECAAAYPVK